MFKKIILLLLLSILFVCSVLPEDWYSYIDKQVKIEVYWGDIYIGKVDDVFPIEDCLDKDYSGLCIFKRTRYTMFLNIQDKTKILRCEDIINIEEIK